MPNRFDVTSRRSVLANHLIRLVFSGIFVFILCCGCDSNIENNSDVAVEQDPASEHKPDAGACELSTVQRIVSSEELILNLTKRMGALNRSAMNLNVPSGKAEDLFSESFELADVSSFESNALNRFLTESVWKIEPVQPGDSIWASFFDNVNYLETAKFYMVDGELDTQNSTLVSTMGFAAHYVGRDTRIGYAKAKMEVTWQLPDEAAPAKILKWKTRRFVTKSAAGRMFAEVTNDVVEDKVIAADLAFSEHADMTEKLILGQPVKTPDDDDYRFFFPEVTLEHPSVSVMDFNSDGWDDFFVSRPHSTSLMFENLANGSFREVSAEIGLQLDYDCTCSLFADFDNDSDSDVFIGRARHRAVYFENVNGSYVKNSEAFGELELPYMVSSIAAADFNNDGLLDVYFSTYSPIEGSHANVLNAGNRWPHFYLDAETRRRFEEKRKTAHPYVDMVGPPNVLLENSEAGFVRSDLSEEVASWRKSFQSSWCDYDQDGDQDLYVCNDFSPDDLYRNDRGKFTRVSDEVGLDRLGFGMGISFNDFNNDGQFDLYVSNMFSKAGTRITRQLEGLNDRIRQMADGNYLYQFDGKSFTLLSLKGAQKTTSITGWSWGGQFCDLDNDGQQDIVVANGYYSAPAAVAGDVDL